jgi:hypothetical protein
VIHAVLADAVLLLHLAFVLFVVLGGLLALRWPVAAWVHLPCAFWGAFVELSGRLCPLTPLENSLRAAAGESGYTGDFVDRYLVPLVYPAGLTRDVQQVLGGFVIVLNLAIYAIVFRRRGRNRKKV